MFSVSTEPIHIAAREVYVLQYRTCTGYDLEESIYHTFIVPCDEAINCGYFQSIRAKARYLSQTQGCSDRTFEGSG